MTLRSNVRIALVVVAVLWLVYLADALAPVDLIWYGLRPRRVQGLRGILFAPFLHANMGHLVANAGALFILLTVALSLSRSLTATAVVTVVLLGGGLVWLTGSPSTVHIGASGLVFGLIGFLMFSGLFRREWKTVLLSVLVFALYGGTLVSLLTPRPGISWSGHFFGFLSGILAAWGTRKKPLGRKGRV